MTKAHFRLAVPALALLLAACGSTSERHRPQQEEWHPAAAILLRYADSAGVVTRAAMEAGLKADFNRIDTNHDGCLNKDEVREENERRWKEDASTYSPLIDFKQLGCVDFQEYAETARSLFDQLDKKGDGKLTPDELKPGETSPGTTPNDQSGHHRHGGGQTPNGG
jgi:EF hand